MYVLGLILFIIHILAFTAGSANGVAMPILGPMIANGSAETRPQLYAIADALSKVGKWSMLVLLVSGVLVLWLKWDFVVPNHWFWAKMGFVAAMLVLIGINEASDKKARAGDAAAAARSKMAGQLTGLAFIGVVISAVLAFN